MCLRIVVLILLAAPAFPQIQRSQITFGGSANDTINDAVVDAAGNIYVVGTTQSFDLPVLNAFQSSNRGTQLVVSSDSGATWQPLLNLFPNPGPVPQLSIVSDPGNGQILYVASGNSVCKSVDGGVHFQCADVFAKSANTIYSLTLDPHQPTTLYATANGAVFKSIDGGQTWSNSSQGIVYPSFIGSIAIDPFRANVLYAWDSLSGYVSTDGAASWKPSTLPAGSGCGGFKFAPLQPGLLYGPASADASRAGFPKSSDGGATWTFLNTPFSSCSIVPDPLTSGVLYAVDQSHFWKSTDGGATWTSSPIPLGTTSPLVVDPVHPAILLAGEFRSTNGGQTWSYSNVSRTNQPVFVHSSPGLVYATASMSSDAFIAKFLPDGQTLAFATYFGGMGDELGQGIALDPAGNIWIAGTTFSSDLPVTPGALQSGLVVHPSSFAAKFSNDGKLLASTYLGGSGTESGVGVAVDPRGNPWFLASPNNGAGIVRELDPAGSQVLYSAVLPGTVANNGHGIAIDSGGNVAIAGWIVPQPFGPPKAFILKLDPGGNVVYSAALGGSKPALLNGNEGEHDYGVSVAVDAAGNVYVTGNTSSADFPTTTGAYQRNTNAGCTYPAFSVATGFIGTIYEWAIDDSFVMRLAPDGGIVYSTLIGGACYDHPTSIAVDASGQVTIAGETDSADYPQVSPLAGAPPMRQFASFVSTFSADGSALPFSTFLYAGPGPTVRALPGGAMLVVGSSGLGAQTSPDSGVFFPLATNAVDGFLTILAPSSGLHVDPLLLMRPRVPAGPIPQLREP